MKKRYNLASLAITAYPAANHLKLNDLLEAKQLLKMQFAKLRM